MLVDEKIRNYVEALASEAPTPGGGAACALTGAQGAALVCMVANLTIGKQKYAEFEQLNTQARDECEQLTRELLGGVDADRDAFGRVAAAYALPRGTDAERAARRDALASASLDAALAPLACMRAALAALRQADALLGRSNANLVSDIYVAAVSLHACIQGAKYNVDVNLPAITDRAYAEALAQEAESILAESAGLHKKILPK